MFGHKLNNCWWGKLLGSIPLRRAPFAMGVLDGWNNFFPFSFNRFFRCFLHFTCKCDLKCARVKRSSTFLCPHILHDDMRVTSGATSAPTGEMMALWASCEALSFLPLKMYLLSAHGSAAAYAVHSNVRTMYSLPSWDADLSFQSGRWKKRGLENPGFRHRNEK